MIKIEIKDCTGCCVCLGEAPDVFDMNDEGKCYSVYGDNVPDEFFHDLLRAETNCPSRAIKVQK